MKEQGRYSKLSEEEAAAQFELRKQQIMGNLLEQYENSQKNKKASKISKPQQELIVFNQKKKVLKNQKKESKQLQLVKEEFHQQNTNPLPESEEEQIQQIVEPTPIAQPPSIDKNHGTHLKKILLKDIGNIDLEIQMLTRETKDFEMNKQANKSQFTYQSSSTNNVALRKNPKQNLSQQQQYSKEQKQRPSSKESHLSNSSYTKKVEGLKGVVRSQSLKKIPQQQYNFSQQKQGSEKKINQSINKTVTIESENKEVTKNKISQSERKTSRPTTNRSQTKQFSSIVEKKSTPIKTMLKVQFNSIPIGSNSTKNKSTSYVCLNKLQEFHEHKESYNSQVSLQKNQCVEAQIEEAVQIYKNLKSLMQSKSNVLQNRKDGNQMLRKTVDFFQHKEIAKPTLF